MQAFGLKLFAFYFPFIINFTNKFLDSSFKLGLLQLVSSIKDDAEISLDNINIGSNQASAQALETYLIRDNISPTVSKKTNQNGNVFFDNLEVGAYLILAAGEKAYEYLADKPDQKVVNPEGIATGEY